MPSLLYLTKSDWHVSCYIIFAICSERVAIHSTTTRGGMGFMAGFQQSLDFTQEQRQWISPVLIEANQVLLLSRAELQTAMRAEIIRNPALEMDFDGPNADETRQCPICGEALHNGWCPFCHNRPQQDSTSRETYEEFPEQWYTASTRR